MSKDSGVLADNAEAYRRTVMVSVLNAVVAAGTAEDEQRDTADLCRRRILEHSNSVARRVAAGEQLPWTIESMGEPH